MAYTARKRKLNRILLGEPPRVLDLFAGCGGISLGFQAAGFLIAGAIERDKLAAKTFAHNFYCSSSYEMAKNRDIENTHPMTLVKELGIGPSVKSAIDVIVGGPPCQAYSRVGRAKLREIGNETDAHLTDSRASLYLKYLEYVEAFHPLVLLMENVPDILNHGGRNIAAEICDSLSLIGYRCVYTVLNAVHYGVPQTRDRLFLMALAQEIGEEPWFPTPTHWMQLPPGYQSFRQRAIRGKRLDNQDSYIVLPPEPSSDLRPAVTVQQALDDLPSLTHHLKGKLQPGVKKFDELLQYPKNKAESYYSWLMKNWPGFENHIGVRDHVLRYLPRDYPIFRRMNPGDQYPEAHKHALAILDEKLQDLDPENPCLVQGSPEYEELKKRTVPPYDTSKFPNKWRKLEPDRPARTLMAHLSRDGYSHIHYDSNQARTITPREAARLQSFPDGFVFVGSMQSAFSQIGNAVPPLLAYRLAQVVAEALGVTPRELPMTVSDAVLPSGRAGDNRVVQETTS